MQTLGNAQPMDVEGEAKNSKSAITNQDFSTDLLRIYYSRLFPYNEMFRWLSYGNDPANNQPWIQKDFFARREFSFTIEDDIYIRYQSFRDEDELRKMIQKRQPFKIDIGAVFSVQPKDHATVKGGSFKPVERELVFDIDLTDYDDIRTCCSGAGICGKCWQFMTMAIRVLDSALRDDFGFRQVVWVYSGRRGVHCWVSDPTARALPNEARQAVVEYLSVVSANENKGKKVDLSWPLHPSLMRAYEALLPLFEQHIITEEGQGLMASSDGWEKILNTVPNEELREKLHSRWSRATDVSSPLEKWEEVVAEVHQLAGKAGQMAARRVSHTNTATAAKRAKHSLASLNVWKYETVFTFTYPRLDANVSVGMNHLLKSPFCVHPKTGRVCVPIDPQKCEEFDPMAVPTLGTLCHQIDSYSGPQVQTDTEKTDMKGYVQFFESEFLRPLYQEIRRNIRDQNDRVSAGATSF